MFILTSRLFSFFPPKDFDIRCGTLRSYLTGRDYNTMPVKLGEFGHGVVKR